MNCLLLPGLRVTPTISYERWLACLFIALRAADFELVRLMAQNVSRHHKNPPMGLA